MNRRILVLSKAYLPGFLSGGPVRSVVNLIDRLGEEFDWRVLTSDRDSGASEPYENVRVDRWNPVGKAEVFYASPSERSPGRFLALLRKTPHDLLYLNSFFNPRLSVFPLLAMRLGLLPRKPVLIAPRGEFSTGALGLKSWKKAPYLVFARAAGLYREAFWQASTPEEAANIARAMRVAPERVRIARNLAAPVGTVTEAAPRPPGPLRVCFLARIVRMKNLDYALRVLAGMREEVDFAVYGPREDAEHWAECERLVGELPPNVRFSYEGPVVPDRVRETLAGHDLLFLPTRGENFGHVLVEAWSAGLSVLTSDQTPWRDLEAQGVGWDLPLAEPEAFANALAGFSRLDDEALAARREACLAFARRHTEDESAVEANRALFLSAAGRRP